MTQKKIWFYGLLSGVMLVLAFPPMPFGVLAFAALVPYLFSLTDNEGPKRPVLFSYVVFYIYHVGTNWWISSWQSETDPFLLAGGIATGLVHPFFFMIPIVIFLFIKRRFGVSKALWVFPFIWTAFEWFHSLGELSYPWLNLGYSQIYHTWWNQIADIGGVYLLSFLIAMVNVLILKVILKVRESGIEPTIKNIFISKAAIKYWIGIAAIAVIPLIYGLITVNRYEHSKLIENNELINMAVIQPNINPWRKWEINPREQIELHKQIQDSIASEMMIDVGIWSETATSYIGPGFNQYHNFYFLQKWVDSSETALITGFADTYFYQPGDDIPPSAKKLDRDPEQRYDNFNASLLLNPAPYDTLNPQIYHKMKLTPMGERFPFADIFSFAMDWMEWGVGISGWQVGQDQHIMTIQAHGKQAKIGTIICIESIYPEFCRNFARLDARVLTVITNDAWYDYTPGPEQHYQIAAMRAIESKRYIARCANTGVSGFITPLGQSIYRAPQYTKTAIAMSVPLIDEKTFYVQHGDWLPYISLAITIMLIVAGFFKRKKA